MAHHRRQHNLMMQDALYVGEHIDDDRSLMLLCIFGGILFVLGVGAVIGLAFYC